MKTVMAINLRDYGIWWKLVPNSVPEGATISAEITKGGPYGDATDRITSFFEVIGVHIALSEDVRVLHLTSEDSFYGNSFGRGWFQVDRKYCVRELPYGIDDALILTVETALKKAMEARLDKERKAKRSAQ